ncbi:MAG: hypothetical protein ACJ77Z_04615, partial [Thermoleophilaceae bacterium]
MRRIVRLIVGAGALTGLALGRGKPKRIVPPGEPDPRAELTVIVLLLLATLASAAFVWIYADDGLRNHTQWEGLTLGLALAFISAALIVVAKRLIVTEYNEEDYPEPETPQEQLAVAQIVRESGSRFTRKRLLRAVAGMAGGTLGLAFLAPAASLGPALDSHRLLETPWRRGKRLVREDNVPVKAAD